MLVKRMCVLFFTAIAAFAVLSCRLALLASNAAYAGAATAQSTHYLSFEDGRGNFYDCRFRPLTGVSASSYALVAPSNESYRALFDVVPEQDRATLYSNIQKSKPFLLPLPQNPATGSAVTATTFLRENRYMAAPFAPQLIGYCDGEGVGKAGLESACEDILKGGGDREEVYCAIDARGNLIDSVQPCLVTQRGTGGGVMLTLDASLQRLCEAAARESMDKGAVVVMETSTGRVRASVSLPDFDPANVAASLNAPDAPFLNRAINAYNVGSVFKPLLAAIALENGYDTGAVYECDGSITVSDHTYRCAYGRGHGEVNLLDALSQSCNCYFVQLGLQLGGDAIAQAMQKVGFGESTVVAGALRTARGNIPTAQELDNLGALASISFGQGTLTATPVQVAAFFNAIANGGVYVSPTFVEGVVNEYTQTLQQSLYNPVVRRCMSTETADLLRAMLVNVVENGLGEGAKPIRAGAGGKTGTAQTGRYTADGEEIMDAWFAGFYPSYAPEYTVVVLLDSGTHNSDDACAVFARVTSALSHFTKGGQAQLAQEAELQRAAKETARQLAARPVSQIAGQPVPAQGEAANSAPADGGAQGGASGGSDSTSESAASQPQAGASQVPSEEASPSASTSASTSESAAAP